MINITFSGKRIDNAQWVEGYYLKLSFDEELHLIVDERGQYHRVEPDSVGCHLELKARTFDYGTWDIREKKSEDEILAEEKRSRISNFIMDR